MGSKWTVTPGEGQRYDLEFRGEPFWIELKRALTHGERNRIRVAGMGSYSRQFTDRHSERLEIHPDFESATYEKVHVWLLDWSLCDDKGNKLPRSMDTYRALHADLYDLIDGTVEVHARAVEEVEKKIVMTDLASHADRQKKIS